MTLEHVFHHTQDEGDELCTRIATIIERNSERRQSVFAKTHHSTQKTKHQVAILEPAHVGRAVSKSDQIEGLYAFQGDMADMADRSISTQYLPSAIMYFAPAE